MKLSTLATWAMAIVLTVGVCSHTPELEQLSL